jgi:hypothetical protein
VNSQQYSYQFIYDLIEFKRALFVQNINLFAVLDKSNKAKMIVLYSKNIIGKWLYSKLTFLLTDTRPLYIDLVLTTSIRDNNEHENQGKTII